MIKIRKVKVTEKIYDINVMDNHNFFANDILVHNCQESFSLTKVATKWKENVGNEQRTITETDGLYHSCSLISVNVGNLVTATDEEKKEVIGLAVKALDKGIDLTDSPVLEAERGSKLLRNIGIGFVGVGDYLAYHKLMFTGDGVKEAEKLMEFFTYYAYKASVELAKEKGSYPLFKKADYSTILGKDPKELNKLSLNGLNWVELQGDIRKYGIRNALLMAIAPNTSCQTKDNKVITKKGVTDIETILTEQGFNIDEIEAKEAHWIDLKEKIDVPTLNGDDVVEKIWYNGKQPIIEIEFEDGNVYKFTHNHKLLVRRGDEAIWVRCDELQEGDDIVEK